MTDSHREAPAASVLRRIRRAVSGAPAGGGRRDPFAEFEDLDGPVLVGGPRIRRDPALDADPRLVVFLPHLALGRMSGGPNTIFQVTAPLVARDVKIRYVAAFGRLEPDRSAILEHIRTLTGVEMATESVDLVDASAPGAVVGVGAGDVPFATWWPTAHLANAALEHVRARAFLSLIQDFEPAFHPWSTKHALAEATYGMPIRAVVNEPFLLDHLRRSGVGRFGEAADPTAAIAFTPAVDRTVFRPPAEAAGPTRELLFYARPRTARNLFELGLRALRVAAQGGAFDDVDWSFRAIGQAIPELRLSARHVLRPAPWRSYAAYGELLAGVDVLLSPMHSPHTSYPPLEMAATGGEVVTTTFGPKTADALAALSPRIAGVAPELDALVEGLTTAVGQVEATRAAGRRRDELNAPVTWSEALADVTPWLSRAIDELRDGASA